MALDPVALFGETERRLGPRYRLERLVAASPERVLFVGRDTILNRRVSVRVNFSGDDQLRTWFIREAEALGQLDHPAIRHVYDVGVVDDMAYRIGNWIEAEGLNQANTRGPRPIPQAHILARDLLRALEHAHAHGIVVRRVVPTSLPAILTYIAQTSPAAKLAPSDPFAYARMQEFNAYLCGTAHVAHAHRMRGARWSDDPAVWENLKLKVPQNMAEIFTLIETTMFQRPWVLGDAYSTSDPYLFTLECWMESDSVKIADFPTLHDHYQRMNDRPAVVRAMAKLAG